MSLTRIVPVALAAGVLAGFGTAAFPGGGNAASTRPVFEPTTWHLVYDFVAVGTTSGERTVTVTNAGTAPEVFGAVEIVGTNPRDFAITADSCSNHAVSPGGSCAVTAVFKPTASGTRLASLRFVDNTPCNNFVQLAGSATAAAATRATAHAASCNGPDTTTETTTVTVQTTTVQTTTVTTTKTVSVPVPTRTVTTQAPAPRPTVNSAQSKQAIRLPKNCASRRRFKVHFKPPAGRTFRKISVRINGRRFKVIRGEQVAALVSLKGLPRGRFTLLIDASLSPTGHYLRKRHYVTCVRNRSS